jgi:hypothetical protein
LYPLPWTFSTEYATIYILDAEVDRFAASIRALRYGFAAHDRKDLVVEGKRYASVDVPYRREEILLVYSMKEPRNVSWNQYTSSDGYSFGPFRHARRINQQYP